MPLLFPCLSIHCLRQNTIPFISFLTLSTRDMLLNHGPLPESLQVAKMENLPGTLTIMGIATVSPSCCINSLRISGSPPIITLLFTHSLNFKNVAHS